MKVGSLRNSAVDARCAPTWKMVDSAKNVEARLASEGARDPDLKEGVVETPG